MAYALAPSLVAYRAEVNARYPNRDRTSDGWIGDAAHSARTSDHNPGARNLVHAYDLDEDLDGDGTDRGAELAWLAEHLRTTRDARVKYVIYEGRMFASYHSVNGPAWQWRPYSGVNAHRKHLHLSILSTVAAEQDTSPWLPGKQAGDVDKPPTISQEDDDMRIVKCYDDGSSGRPWLLTFGSTYVPLTEVPKGSVPVLELGRDDYDEYRRKADEAEQIASRTDMRLAALVEIEGREERDRVAQG